MPNQLEYDHDVFISYSSRDKTWVRGDLLKRIEQAGLRVFIDFRDFIRGAPSISECERGVLTSRKILLVLTPAYIESEWCEMESIMAHTLSPANRDLRLIPLLKTQCEKPFRIGALAHIDFTDGADFDLAWNQLLASLDAQPAEVAEQAIPAEIKAELGKAKDLMDADQYSQAIPILERALAAADESGHTVARAKVRVSVAQALYEANEDFIGAEQHLRDALVLVPVENVDLRHNVLLGLGDMLLFSGRLDEARATIDTALGIARLSGKKDDLAGSLISSSLLDRTLGFHDSAVAKLDEAVRLLHQQALSLLDDEKKQHAHTLAVCYINEALLCRDTGNLDEALVFYGKVEDQHHISGDRLNAGKALLFCGEVHCTNADWQKGLVCFGRALQLFKEVSNPLWGARCLHSVSRVYATHEEWEEALVAILGAIAGAEESGNPGDQVRFLRLAAVLTRNWKTKMARDDVARSLHRLAMETPEDKKADVMSRASADMSEVSDAIENTVREDNEVRKFLNRAKEISSREHLHEHLADCLLDEAYDIAPPDDAEARRDLIVQAIELLREELRSANFPRSRGHLFGQISMLYGQLGEHHEATSWLRKAGNIFEESGDVFGLANYYGSLAAMYRVERRWEDEVAAYRKALSLIEGRSFYHLAAGTRIKLAATLRLRRKFGEAQRLLDEAEVISNQHRFDDFLTAIARYRSKIETELQAAQAPTCSFSELIGSLHQLIKYSPKHAVAYLPFWLFVWQTELFALLRSGPHLSFMVVTDDLERFMNLTAKFRNLATYFLLTTTSDPKVKVDAVVLPIPPTWLFPATFRFLMMKRSTPESSQPKEALESQSEEEDNPPRIHLAGPATMLPMYMPVDRKSEVEGEGHMMALSTGHLPKQAIDLMVNRSRRELIQRRAVWFPTKRISSKDPFLTDLGIGYERGVIPVYFDSFPASEEVSVIAGVEITIPGEFLDQASARISAKWSRALLKLTKSSRDEAQTALLDLPDVFPEADNQAPDSCRIEIRLFEFDEIGELVFHPALLIPK